MPAGRSRSRRSQEVIAPSRYARSFICGVHSWGDGDADGDGDAPAIVDGDGHSLTYPSCCNRSQVSSGEYDGFGAAACAQGAGEDTGAVLAVPAGGNTRTRTQRT